MKQDVQTQTDFLPTFKIERFYSIYNAVGTESFQKYLIY